ncbi:MAG: IS630 family transposase [Deltaproteobacteria bacterium]|nr:IS630 family transposase [Deltaproteobacteria bacterium]
MVPAISGEFVERMEDVLRLYARAYDARYPVVCLDERPVVLRGSKRSGRTVSPGKDARTDYEYVRRGTANVFCIVEPKTGRRLTHTTRRRTNRDFAHALQRVSKAFPKANRIHLVVDNLSTHTKKACIETFGDKAGRALWRRFKVHYTPKHGSWLNAAEMEASLVGRQCLGTRRIPDLATLREQVNAWRTEASRAGMVIRWAFNVKDARRVFRYEALTSRRSKH